jgi:GT2 family glycosyltransferase
MKSKIRALPYVLLLLPLDVVVAVGLVTSMVVGVFKRGLKRATTSMSEHVVAGCSPRCTIVIVSWDGKHLLAECLPSVVEAVQHDGGDHGILVVDNGSTDDSVEFLRTNFPQVQVLALDRNYGFSEGNNRGVAKISTDIVVLLNNDMIVDPNFLRPLLNGFADPSVFAVTSQIFFQDSTRRREETGKTRGRFHRGEFYLWHDEIHPEDDACENTPVFWAGGGSCAIDRKKFLSIGGFDSLYHPFYVEDTDLSYQAWKRGWKCLLAPASKVVHKHRSTTKRKFGNEFVERAVRKNQYLFVWKNVTDVPMLLTHLINLPRLHGRALMADLKPATEIRGYVRAVWQLPHALVNRLANLSAYSVSDREVMLRAQKP